jgi:hypothetical protein
MPTEKKLQRCPNGTRRNKKTGLCDPIIPKKPENKNNDNREPLQAQIQPLQLQGQPQPDQPKNTSKKIKATKKCPNGTRRNKKTGNCEPLDKNIKKMKESVKQSTKKPIILPASRRSSTLAPRTQKSNTLNKPARKIQNFMLKNKPKIRALFLNTICSDSGSCIALGTNSDKIKKFFNGFTDFSYLSTLKKIGKNSVNGAVYELKYLHRDYNSYAIIKLNSSLGSDSLLYEYFVGKRLNHYGKYFPNFLETYGSYTVTPDTWNNVMTSSITIPELQKDFKLNTKSEVSQLAENCNYQYHKIFAIMIQHLNLKKDESTLDDCMKLPRFVKHDLLYTLFQIYTTLSVLADVYTHYDLHSDNVLMYVPDDDKYIEYYYHYPGGKVVTFKSKYIVKIIDYGRNYVHVDGIPEDSASFYQKLCKTKECNTKRSKCGRAYGFSYLDPTYTDSFITCSKKNISHDLRLVDYILKYSGSIIYNNRPYLYRILSQTVFTHKFGTAEIIDSGLSYNRIHNVKDMEVSLLPIVEKPENQQKNDDSYSGKTKMGDLHIYTDMSKEMEYVSV